MKHAHRTGDNDRHTVEALMTIDPQIGIFWYYSNTVLGKTRPLEEGVERWPGLLDSRDDHMSTWEEKGFLNRFPELRYREYMDVQRGRVLFSTKDDHTVIYADEKLKSERVRRQIICFFALAPDKVTWKQEPHYTTDPDKIDKLFGDD